MRIYTCCPNESCNCFQDTLSLLHSFGIEPAMEVDKGGQHYLEFKTNKRTDKEGLFLDLSKKTDSPLCKCGRFLRGKPSFQIITLQNHTTGVSKEFCPTCFHRQKFTKAEIDEIMNAE